MFQTTTNQCEVPTMYQQVNGGLIDPTWEPEGEMRAQIPRLSENDLVCWYGNRDGSVTAQINQTPISHKYHLFRKVDERWLLVESGESITID